MRASPDFAAGLVDLYQAVGTAGYNIEPRTADSTTPTAFETYVAGTLKPAYEAIQNTPAT